MPEIFTIWPFKEKFVEPGTVVCTCNPGGWAGGGGRPA